MCIRKFMLMAAAIGISTTGVVYLESRILPTAEGLVGHDFEYFFPYLLSGVQWIELHGWWTVPHFTPDYCGGMPWLANPQSMFYSVPQLLALVTDLVRAVKLTTILFAAIGAGAIYGLLRRCFGISWQASTLGFVLFQLNGFLIFRIGIGHLTYHVYGLAPLICLCALLPGSSNIAASRSGTLFWSACAIVAGGSLLAAMVYGGALNYIIPVVLCASAVLLLQQSRTGWQLLPWAVLTGAALWAIPVSALKLVPSFILATQFPAPILQIFIAIRSHF